MIEIVKCHIFASMELPSLISPEFAYLKNAETDLGLFDSLVKNTESLLRFFRYASEDETWSGNHEEFMAQAMLWFTNQFFLERLDRRYAEEVATAYYEHYNILHKILPYNIKVKIQSRIYPMNSLLLGVQSSYLYHLISQELKEKRKKVLALPAINEKNAPFVINYLEKSDLQNLWKLEKSEILSLLELADKLHLEPLAEECQSILKRYLTIDNVLETIIQAHSKRWFILKEACVDFVNQRNWGVELIAIDQDHLGFEFLLFSERTWEIYNKLNLCITHLIVSKNLPMQERFSDVLHHSPKLISLNLSGSEQLSPYLGEVPEKVKELILDRCIWLSDKTLKSIAPLFSQISQLSLSRNTDITYTGFGELKKFPELKSLQLSYCHQIGDEELSLILQTCLGLREIDLSGCKNISSKGFIEVAQTLTRLTFVNASRTAINDSGLFELANRAHFLETAELCHCFEITEKGISYFLKNSVNLRVLNLAETKLSLEFIQSLQKNYPKVRFNH